jgi:hypothetical protein
MKGAQLPVEAVVSAEIFKFFFPYNAVQPLKTLDLGYTGPRFLGFSWQDLQEILDRLMSTCQT